MTRSPIAYASLRDSTTSPAAKARIVSPIWTGGA
jgi:hypothetical protein